MIEKEINQYDFTAQDEKAWEEELHKLKRERVQRGMVISLWAFPLIMLADFILVDDNYLEWMIVRLFPTLVIGTIYIINQRMKLNPDTIIFIVAALLFTSIAWMVSPKQTWQSFLAANTVAFIAFSAIAIIQRFTAFLIVGYVIGMNAILYPLQHNLGLAVFLSTYGTALIISGVLFIFAVDSRFRILKRNFMTAYALQNSYAMLEQKNVEIEKKSKALEESYDNIERLSKIGQEITAQISIENIIQTLYQEIRGLIPFHTLLVGVQNNQTKRGELLVYHIHHGQDQVSKPEIYTSQETHLPGMFVFQTSEALQMNDYVLEYPEKFSNQKEIPRLGDSFPRAALYTPYSDGQNNLGFIGLHHSKTNSFDDYHLSILQSLASYMMIALENAKNFALLEASKEVIEEKNKNITDSITYAKRIQEAILPPKEEIASCFPEHFIFYTPRDIVSGDFYWFAHTESVPIYQESGNFQISEKVLEGFDNEKVVLAAVDATGHGVPGAFMSMIGNDLLGQIVQDNHTHHADEILNELHHRIRKVLNQENTQIQDGMDVALVVIDLEEKTLEFAGAKNPLVYIQNNEVNLIKGDKFSIGGEHLGMDRKFTKHTIDVSQKTTFYLYSDGFQDQFGGKNDRKFMSRRFRELLFEIHQLPMQEQRQILETTFQNWMKEGNVEQVDDVLIIGAQI